MKLFVNLFLFVAVAIASVSCEKNDNNLDIPDIEPEINPIISSGENATIPAMFISSQESEISKAIKSRIPNNFVGTTATGAEMVIAAQNELLANIKTVAEAYSNGKIIVVISPDYSEIKKAFETEGYNIAMPDFAAGKNMLVAFNKYGYLYDVDEPADNGDDGISEGNSYNGVNSSIGGGVIDYADYLNPFVSWLNRTSKEVEELENKALRLTTGTEPADVVKTFNAQKVEHTYTIKLKKEISHVILSHPDVIEATSQLTIRFTIYPLYAFEDQVSNGDYYIVTAESVIENKPMYLGSFTRKHGGVKVRMCCYIFSEYYLDMEFDGETKPLFDVTPCPKTTAVSVTCDEGFSWNLGGSITGGFSGFDLTGALSLSGGVAFSNSQSVTYPDLVVENNSTGNGKVSYRYDVPVDLMGYMQGTSIHEPEAVVCKAGTTLSSSWVWRVNSTKDNEDRSFKVKVNPNLSYAAMHFITIGSTDGVWHNFKDAIADTEKTFTLELMAPNRTPTGMWSLSNTFANGEYISDIVVYDANDTEMKNPVHRVNGSVAPGKDYTTNLRTGSYMVTFKAGRSADATKLYKSISSFEIKRAEHYTSNSGFDFK